MTCKLFQKKKGINPIVKLELEIEKDFVSCVSTKDNNLAFLFDNKISILNLDSKELIDISTSFDGDSSFEKACDFCYDVKNEMFYVVSDGGRNIYQIKENDGHVISFLHGNTKSFMDNILKKHKSTCCYIALDEENGFYLSIKEINKILYCNGTIISEYAGNGFAGYSVASNILASKFYNPCGMAYKSGTLYVSDQGNSCIRAITKDTIKTVFVSPSEKKFLPEKICIDKNAFYFSSGKSIYLSEKTIAEDILNKNSFCLDQSGNLYYLKE